MNPSQTRRSGLQRDLLAGPARVPGSSRTRGAAAITNIPADVDLASLTSDPDDEHVCALAIAAEAHLLITFDTAFDHGALLAHGIRVVEPDAVLAPAYDEQPDLLLAILERQAAAWGDRSPSELLDALERAGVPGFARNARAARSPG